MDWRIVADKEDTFNSLSLHDDTAYIYKPGFMKEFSKAIFTDEFAYYIGYEAQDDKYALRLGNQLDVQLGKILFFKTLALANGLLLYHMYYTDFYIFGSKALVGQLDLPNCKSISEDDFFRQLDSI